MSTTKAPQPDSVAAIFAQDVLKLGFSDADKLRMRELCKRNRESELTLAETDELDNFVKVADLLAILQSKARKSLS